MHVARRYRIGHRPPQHGERFRIERGVSDRVVRIALVALAVYCSSWTFYGAVGSAVRAVDAPTSWAGSFLPATSNECPPPANHSMSAT